MSDTTRITDMEDREKANITKILFQNWYIVLSIVGIIVTWTTLTIKTQANTENITNENIAMETHKVEQQTTFTQIAMQLAQIQTDLAWIKTKLK